MLPELISLGQFETKMSTSDTCSQDSHKVSRFEAKNVHIGQMPPYYCALTRGGREEKLTDGGVVFFNET
jgi:hypothetical protein